MVSRAHHISLARVRRLKKVASAETIYRMPPAISAHIVPIRNLTVGAINSSIFLQEIRKMNRYSGAMKCFAASCALSIFPLSSFAQNYVQTNLVSDIPQLANADGTSVSIDAHLKNAWSSRV